MNLFTQGQEEVFAGSALLGLGKAAMAAGEATNLATFINPTFAGQHAAAAASVDCPPPWQSAAWRAR